MFFLFCLFATAFCVQNGGFRVISSDPSYSFDLTSVNNSLVIVYPVVNSSAVCTNASNPFTVTQNQNKTICPKYFTGINNDLPRCGLDIGYDTCVKDLKVSGSLTNGGTCDLTSRVCSTPQNALVPLQSIISPSVMQADYTLTSNTLRGGSKFGQSVDVNSTFIISGAPLAISPLWPSLVTGSAFIFQSYLSYANTSFTSLRWVQTQSLSPFSTSTSTEVTDCRFGTSVRLLSGSDNILQFAAVGAPNSRISVVNAGAVYMFRNVGSVINIDGNTFPIVDPDQRLVSPNNNANALFGYTVRFGLFRDGKKHIFVGAPGDQNSINQNDAGTVWWFNWNNDNNLWEGGTRITCIYTGPSSSARFSKCGASIDFAQDPSGLALMVVGAPEYQRNAGLVGAGSITIFQWDTVTLQWVQAGGYIPNVGDSFYGTSFFYGFSVGFSGNAAWLFIGVPGATYNATLGIGVTVVYQQLVSNSSTYNQYRQPMVIPTSPEIVGTPDNFGYALVSNWHSNWVIICAPGYGLITIPNSGICFKFVYSSATGFWNTTFFTIKGENPQGTSLFGYSVAIDELQITTGSPSYKIGPIDNGIVSVNYDISSFTYVRNTTCISERGVLPYILTMSCSFVMQNEIPSGFYMISTNTSVLSIPRPLIQFVVYTFSDFGSTHMDSYYSIKYFNPTIATEDLFIFYIMSRTHTSATINMIAKIYLNL